MSKHVKEQGTRPVVKNSSAQFIAATRAQEKSKQPAKKTGGDLRSK